MTGRGRNGAAARIRLSSSNNAMSEADTLSTVVTYLEMHAKPTAPTPPRPAAKIELMRAEMPPVSFYRYLYDTIGEDWLWYERRIISNDDLTNIIHHPDVEIFVLSFGGVPAGYGELDRRAAGEVELAYFGLMPEFVGHGVGLFFLRWLVDQAWTYEPELLWVHTFYLDHPNALQVYQKAGFAPYQRETVTFTDPRTEGYFPAWRDPRPE